MDIFIIGCPNCGDLAITDGQSYLCQNYCGGNMWKIYEQVSKGRYGPLRDKFCARVNPDGNIALSDPVYVAMGRPKFVMLGGDGTKTGIIPTSAEDQNAYTVQDIGPNGKHGWVRITAKGFCEQQNLTHPQEILIWPVTMNGRVAIIDNVQALIQKFSHIARHRSKL